MRGWLSYSLAMIGYIALSFVTKRFITWTWGPFFFIFWLEIVPRFFGRHRRARRGSVAAEQRPTAVATVDS